MELKDLVGEKMFSGIDFNTERLANDDEFEAEDCECVNFILDGITYTAIEDPEDGYRSMMKELKQGLGNIKNTFKPVRVLARMKEDNNYDCNEILQLINLKNGKTVFEVGTGNTWDYYPFWVATFFPENLTE